MKKCKHDFFCEEYKEIPVCKHCGKSAYVIIKAEQQAHNDLREKLKNVDPWVWDGSSREYFCVFCTARYNPTIKEDFIHDEDCLLPQAIKEDSK